MPNPLDRIEQALDRNDIPGAALLAAQALDAGTEDPLLYNLVSWRHEQDGRYGEASALLERALARWPDDPALHLALGVVQRSEGSLSAAVKSFERAIELDPGYAAAWFERGATFEKGGALADAAKDFAHTLKLDPGSAAAHAALATGHARRRDHEPARAHANEALRLDPGNVAACNALAVVAIEEQRFDDAIAVLEPAVARRGEVRELMVGVRTLLGDAYEGAGRYADAYRSYDEAQRQFHAIHSERLGEDRRSALAFVERVADGLDAADATLWRSADEVADRPAVAGHVFLTGYPRSGTTLVENILATLPGAVAIEERPTLAAIDREFLGKDGGVARLAELSGAALAEQRALYWDKAQDAAGEPLDGRMFVDMDPFKGVRLPAIAKLFPDAKVILMRRDPRDVVWSCFHTSFAFNAGTLAFTTLESTARHYAATQRVIARSLAALPIVAFELRYETLVRNFDAATKDLCAFLGVDWSEELRQFDRTAERRGVSTASGTQIRRGLYDGSGGWRRYAEQLRAVEPILAPWIERLGYA